MSNDIVLFVDTEHIPTNNKYGEWKNVSIDFPKGSKYKINTNVKWKGGIETITSEFAKFIIDLHSSKVWYGRDTEDHEETLPLDKEEEWFVYELSRSI